MKKASVIWAVPHPSCLSFPSITTAPGPTPNFDKPWTGKSIGRRRRRTRWNKWTASSTSCWTRFVRWSLISVRSSREWWTTQSGNFGRTSIPWSNSKSQANRSPPKRIFLAKFSRPSKLSTQLRSAEKTKKSWRKILSRIPSRPRDSCRKG